MATLQEMYQEEREHHSVRESIRRVGARTGSEPASVARRLGFDPNRLPVGPVVAGPTSARQEGRCNACQEKTPDDVFSIHAGGMSIRLCRGCCGDLLTRLMAATR